ncbi:MAG: orotate phosphoribosyltransferase [Planctomycetes bacterium]|nr:orotate phosphoribosyltransferase [Planctomycetota bacterium]
MSGAPTLDPNLRKSLVDLVLSVAFERRKVILASGRESDFYLDMRQVLMRPRGIHLAGELTYELLRQGPPIAAVGGMAVGAVPYVSAVLGAAARQPGGESLLGFFVRKEAKAHGLGRQIEGPFRAGMEVALVEDTTTTGGSTLAAAKIVRESGGVVRRVIALIDRGEGAREAFAAEGMTLESILTRADLPLGK